MNPKISVITINYNNKSGLEKTLKSVTSQDYGNYEYIVIDGGSNDGSRELIEQYENKIAHWKSEADKGIYNAMNKGIRAARGEYLIFINSGDHFYNEHSLSTGEEFFSGEDIIYGNLLIASDANTYIKKYLPKLSLFYFFHESLPHPATFILKEAFEKYGFYDENLKIVADWKWFLISICTNGASYKHIDKTISTFYLDGISSNHENQKKINIERQQTFTTYFPLVKDDLQQLKDLQHENYYLRNIENKFNRLKKYRVVKLLNRLGLIKISD